MSGLTDRELLEGAARAIGITISLYHDDYGKYSVNGARGPGTWNPLTDDGDALRLAAKLGLVVSTDSRSVYAQTIPGITPAAYASQGGPDQMESIRRAVVRAAYEIGSAKP